jgi:hypothetical protein
MTNLSTQQKKVDKVVEAYLNIFSSLTEVPLHCQVKHLIDMIPDAPLPNGPVYRHSLLENDEIQVEDPRTVPKGAHMCQLITLWEPNRTSTEEIWNLVTLY